MAEQSVTLQPGESRVVSFEATPQEAKTYNVSVDGLTGSFTALSPVVTVEDIRAFISKFSGANAEYLNGALDELLVYKQRGYGGIGGYWAVVKMNAESGVKWCATFVDMVKAAGLYPGPVVLNWGAFPDALDGQLGGPKSLVDYPEFIVINNCYAFTTYVAEKFVPSAWLLTTGPQMEDSKQLGYTILKVGLEHPELLGPTVLAPLAPREYKWGQDGAYTTWMAKFGVMPYPGFSWEDKTPLITRPDQESPEMVTVAVNTVSYIGQQPGVGPFVAYIITYKVSNWVLQQGFGHPATTALLYALLS